MGPRPGPRLPATAIALLLLAASLVACLPPRVGQRDQRRRSAASANTVAVEATVTADPQLAVATAVQGVAGGPAVPNAGYPGALEATAIAEAYATATALASYGVPAVPPTPPWVPQPTFALPSPTAPPMAAPTDPPTLTPDPFAQIGTPARLQLPSVGVDAPIQPVGITGDRAMDVPDDWMDVGWYAQGFRPGEEGNAVIAGHLDTNHGGPAVFWDLDKLMPGDEAIVTYTNGDRYTFVVQGSEIYDHDAQGPIIDQIFGQALTPNLNLITCDGAWDRGRATYTKRLVVFATLSPEKTVRSGSAGAYQ
jgi:sortase (surface protein transpeptidase)